MEGGPNPRVYNYGGPNPLADLVRGGPHPLADLVRGDQIRGGTKSAGGPNPLLHRSDQPESCGGKNVRLLREPFLFFSAGQNGQMAATLDLS